MRGVLLLGGLVVALQGAPAAADVVVNCGPTTSLNRALEGLDKHTPVTVWVMGTCREYVRVRGHEGLTLKGLPGALLLQPTAVPPGLLLPAVLSIESSRGVTVQGLRVQAAEAFGISIGLGSSDVRLRTLTVEGGAYGISIHGGSQVSLAGITGREPGWAAVGIWDASAVSLEDSLFERSSTAGYRAGIQVGKSALVMHGTTIRDFQEGIVAEHGGMIDVHDISAFFPPGGQSEVLIESPAGTSFVGLRVRGGSVHLSTKLRITNPGQGWGDDTAGVLVEDGGTLGADATLEVVDSRGQGLLVRNSSHVTLGASRVTGSLHGGLVVVNLSTLSVVGSAPAEIAGNAPDLFCDSRSLITGGANVAGTPSAQCAHLLAGASEPLP